MNGSGYLAIAEVVYASGATPAVTASLSSTYSDAVAFRAIDGNTNGNYYSNSVAVSDFQVQPFLQIDLGTSRSLTNVTVYGRTDCCASQSSNLVLFVSDNPFTSNDLDTTRNQPGVTNYAVANASSSPATLAVNRTGRYLRVQMNGSGYLAIAEVVYASGSEPDTAVTFTNTPLGRGLFDEKGFTIPLPPFDDRPRGDILGQQSCHLAQRSRAGMMSYLFGCL